MFRASGAAAVVETIVGRKLNTRGFYILQVSPGRLFAIEKGGVEG
ncbi:MAG: hypothetical protein ACERKO_09375 [Acetanaerobacterium sp.]